ncbi:MAG: hypothetical protein WBD53_12985, partial [Xanthobacteraceae bacterium]
MTFTNRRLGIFESAKRLFAVIFESGRTPREEFYKYVANTSEAVFLLDSTIVAYLEEIRRRAAQMIFVESRLR